VSKRVRTFLYILPNEHSVTTSSHPALERLGLGHLKGTSLVHSRVVGGPGNVSGSLVMALPTGAEEHEGKCAYLPEQQTWMQAPGYWIGAYRDAMPRPEDLERPEQVTGYPMPLGDGQMWMIPLAAGERRQLPTRMRWGVDGKWVSEIVPELEAFSGAVEAVAQQVYTTGRIVLPESEQAELAVRALAVNYRIGPAEAAMLDLFNPATSMFQRVFWAVTDYDWYTRIREQPNVPFEGSDTPVS
jgi:hypothetical protein